MPIPAATSDNRDVDEPYGLRHFFQQIALYARMAASRP
jgi:hypothetical protein